MGLGYITLPNRHAGVDLEAPEGTAVLATAPGHIHLVMHGRKGTIIGIDHGDSGTFTAYGHLEKAFVEEGDIVERGQEIGCVGDLPRAGRVPHLHWELCERPCVGWHSLAIDPLVDLRPCFRDCQAIVKLTPLRH